MRGTLPLATAALILALAKFGESLIKRLARSKKPWQRMRPEQLLALNKEIRLQRLFSGLLALETGLRIEAGTGAYLGKC